MSAESDSGRMTTRRRVMAALALGAGGGVVHAANTAATDGEEILSMEGIRQKVAFKAPPERIYAALLDASVFQKVSLLSAAIRSGMVKATPLSRITRQAGGEFAIFGGHITGRQIQLVPHTRIVQAWRPADWEPGVYSIARFELAPAGTGTALLFEHTGFPKGQAAHLAEGWQENYWKPLEKFLS